MNICNLVQIESKPPGASAYSHGSGYIVGDGTILTARHVLCTMDQRTDDVESIFVLQCLKNDDVTEVTWMAAVCTWSDAGADIAVLRLQEGSFVMAQVEIPEFGRINTQDRFRFSAVGFPKAEYDQEKKTAGSREVTGKAVPLNQLQNSDKQISLEELTNPFDDPDLWSGMSGAAVFTKEQPRRLFGVVTTTRGDFRATALTAGLISSVHDKDDCPLRNVPLKSIGAASGPVNTVDLSRHLRFADYVQQVESLTRKLTLETAKRVSGFKPLVFSVLGLPEDQLSEFAKRLEDELPKVLPPRSGNEIRTVEDAGEMVANLELSIAPHRPNRDLAETRRAFIEKASLDLDYVESQEFGPQFLTACNSRNGARGFISYIRSDGFSLRKQDLLTLWLEDWLAASAQPMADQFVYVVCFESCGPAPQEGLSRIFNKIPLLGERGDRFVTFLQDGFADLGERHVSLGMISAVNWRPEIYNWLESAEIKARVPWNRAQWRAALSTVSAKAGRFEDKENRPPDRMKEWGDLLERPDDEENRTF